MPALKSLPDDFEIAALSTSRRESADAGSRRFGVPRVRQSRSLMNSPDVDVVAITVKVPYHFELATSRHTGDTKRCPDARRALAHSPESEVSGYSIGILRQCPAAAIIAHR
ncbi:MAG: hypothetical protein ACJ8BF_15480 [Gemmatimonadales bacterium]